MCQKGRKGLVCSRTLRRFPCLSDAAGVEQPFDETAWKTAWKTAWDEAELRGVHSATPRTTCCVSSFQYIGSFLIASVEPLGNDALHDKTGDAVSLSGKSGVFRKLISPIGRPTIWSNTTCRTLLMAIQIRQNWLGSRGTRATFISSWLESIRHNFSDIQFFDLVFDLV